MSSGGHDEAMSIQAEYRNATNRLQTQITLNRLNPSQGDGMEDFSRKGGGS